MPCEDSSKCDRGCDCDPIAEEPLDSGGSSKDDWCTCGCRRSAHMGKPSGCGQHGFHPFARKDALCGSCDAGLPMNCTCPPRGVPKHPEGMTHKECPTCWRGAYEKCMCCHPELADEPLNRLSPGVEAEFMESLEQLQRGEKGPALTAEEEEALCAEHLFGQECPCPPSCGCCRVEDYVREPCDDVGGATPPQEPPPTAEEEGEGCPHIGSEKTSGQNSPERYTDFRCFDCGSAWRRYWDRAGEPTEPLPQATQAQEAREWAAEGADDGCWCGHPEDRHWTGAASMTFPDGCHDCSGWNGAHAYGQELPWAPDGRRAKAELARRGAAEEEEEAIADVARRAVKDSHDDSPETPMSLPRRPPVAVAYGIEGGAFFEVLVPGDATVAALEGRLVITHARQVAGIVQIKPYGEGSA